MQMELALATILTLGVTFGLTVIVIVFEVAVAGTAQKAVEVIMQVTVFPLANAVDAKVGLFVPAFDPFTCH
jgi:uncharacterized membrane protein